MEAARKIRVEKKGVEIISTPGSVRGRERVHMKQSMFELATCLAVSGAARIARVDMKMQVGEAAWHHCNALH